jgi:quercetin 2,3-dioxygenase
MQVPPNSRSVESIVRGNPTSDGAGVKLTRILDQTHHKRLDPFLLLDEFGSDSPNDYIAGFPNHPHRGFETVTYMLEGRMRHRDSNGDEGVLGPGDVQWMTAGRGIIHSEMPEQDKGRMHGFQLWINLPAREKMCPPRYRGLAAAEIPQFDAAPGIRVKVVAGTFGATVGPILGLSADPLFFDIAFAQGADLQVPIPVGHNAFVYVYGGEILAGPQQQRLQPGQLALLGNEPDAPCIDLASFDAARVLVIAGRPIGEPVVQWGPFVMNSREEIEQAIFDYNNGTLV